MAKITEQYRLLGKGRGRLNHKDKSQSESTGIDLIIKGIKHILWGGRPFAMQLLTGLKAGTKTETENVA